MPRAKGGPKTRRRHKRQLKLASGFVGGRKLYRQARSTLEKGLPHAYRDRKQKKRDYRTLWIARIHALARASSIEPRRSKRRAPGNHVGRSPTWFFVFGACNIALRMNGETELDGRGRPR